MRLLAVGHSDSAKEELAWELDRRYPAHPDQPEGAAKVLRTGEPQLLTEIPDESGRGERRGRRAPPADQGPRAQLRDGAAPAARGYTFAAMTLISAESERHYDGDDLEFALELAKRASLSIDNARLHSDLEARRHELEFLATASAALDRSLDLDETLQSVADLAVPYLADGCMVDLLDDSGTIRRVAAARRIRRSSQSSNGCSRTTSTSRASTRSRSQCGRGSCRSSTTSAKSSAASGREWTTLTSRTCAPGLRGPRS